MKVARLVIPGNDQAKTAPSTAAFLSSRERRDFSRAGFRAEDQVVPATECNQQDRLATSLALLLSSFLRYQTKVFEVGVLFSKVQHLDAVEVGR